MRTNDRRAEINADLIPDHKYEVRVRAVGPDGTLQPIEEAVANTIVIQGKQAGPVSPDDLTATGFLNSIHLTWTPPDNFDYHHMEIWRSASDDLGTAEILTTSPNKSYIDVIGAPNLTYYYWIRAINTSGEASGFDPTTTAGVSGTSEGVAATEIDDFAVTATKLYTNTIVLTGDSWSNNSPGAGAVAWNEHYLVYGGAYYKVAAGSTANRYVYWDEGNTGGSGTVSDPYLTTYTGSATYVHAADRFVVVTNESGVVQKVWNSSANMVIGTLFVLDAAITNAKIQSMTASKLTAGTIDASVINVTNLNADNISTGTLTGRTVQTAASGQRIVLSQADNTLRFHTGAISNVILIDDNISGSRPGMKIEDATNGVGVILKKDVANQISIVENRVSAYSNINAYNFYGYQAGTQTLAMCYLERATGTGPFIRFDLGASKVFEVDHVGNVTVGGNVDGRNVATDGSKLDGIAAGAQPGTVTSVGGTSPVVSSGGTTPVISMGAASAVANGYMTSTYAGKLDGIAAGAQPGTVTAVTGTSPIVSSGGNTPAISIPAASAVASGYMSSTDKSRLDQLWTWFSPVAPGSGTPGDTIEVNGVSTAYKFV